MAGGIQHYGVLPADPCSTQPLRQGFDVRERKTQLAGGIRQRLYLIHERRPRDVGRRVVPKATAYAVTPLRTLQMHGGVEQPQVGIRQLCRQLFWSEQKTRAHIHLHSKIRDHNRYGAPALSAGTGGTAQRRNGSEPAGSGRNMSISGDFA